MVFTELDNRILLDYGPPPPSLPSCFVLTELLVAQSDTLQS